MLSASVYLCFQAGAAEERHDPAHSQTTIHLAGDLDNYNDGIDCLCVAGLEDEFGLGVRRAIGWGLREESRSWTTR